jgi:hypothetical protein
MSCSVRGERSLAWRHFQVLCFSFSIHSREGGRVEGLTG